MKNNTSYYLKLSRNISEDSVVTTKYCSTIHAQGAWNDHEQHMAPATGVIAAELEAFQVREDMRIARVSLDILGIIHGGEFEIVTKLIRPGRTIELIESQMIAKGRTCIIARAWRLQTCDSNTIAGIENDPVPTHDQLTKWDGMKVWPGGYIASLEAFADESRRPGKGLVWISSPYDMVDGEKTSSFVRLLGLVDTMNGIVPRLDPSSDGWAYPNLDLQIHLLRQPTGKWLGIEAMQQYGNDGIGLTSAILHDSNGPFGHSEQILTLRKI